MSLPASGWALAAAVALAAALDWRFGEPRNAWHPVAWLGTAAGWLGRRLPAAPAGRAIAAGGLAWALVVAVAAALAAALQWALWQLPPWAAVPLLALALKPAFAWRMLHDEVAAVEAAFAHGGLTAARARLARLCSREVQALDAEGVRETAIETLAENLNDSLVAPLFWLAVAGLPGAWAWRAVNTLDAMWGYRSPRWQWAGRCAARADDLLGWLPARLSAALLWLAGGARGIAPAALRREAARTPSPNGGWPMGAMALRLDVRLGKPGVYTLHAAGRAPQATDTRQALALGRRAAVLAFVLAGLVLAGSGVLLGHGWPVGLGLAAGSGWLR
ncbi:adenosylcobinamide-phosphate synthase CbiB [Aquabacterium sp. OR-4]|uniref:adenosylcobinamide-phosphate synthase CbiB n=1 Tax=Aquabacterium sp. OR-4 TaxID=2978127 RepID=UPI0021B31229|nr:adenosylcobinamide-phosphate synthase CbiB [Aquabacterium sp. OR-4]MDT7836120.1 adenosylcobinamide-phosphate synthase CbiB [Aquabacterium sp. OR-4]